MDDIERTQEALALEELTLTPGWLALQKVLGRMKQDQIRDLAQDPNVSRKFTNGYLRALDILQSTVADEIAWAHAQIEEQQEKEAVLVRVRRGQALEGGGTGDLT